MGAPDSTDEKLHRALEAVGADGWASRLPEGLATKVGGRDHALTPAQVQQVALARVILAAPQVVVLDEATSMLGANAASDVERGLDRMLEGRTAVGIAHRLSTAHDADRVAVGEHGRITRRTHRQEWELCRPPATLAWLIPIAALRRLLFADVHRNCGEPKQFPPSMLYFSMPRQNIRAEFTTVE